MPPVQLTRLRSQINAVAIHFPDNKDFKQSLISLLELYSDQKAVSRDWYKSETSIVDLHVPHSVLTELDSRLELLSKLQPKSALANADLLWATEFYEVKHSAISILAGLSSTQQTPVIERIRNWITHDLDQRLMIEILDAFKNQPDILLNDQWIDSLSQWLSGSDDDIRRIGLKAIQETIRMNYKNLPKIFKLLNPVFQNPRISYQKELVDVIRVLIERSEAETASFMIMTATLYPNKDVRAFVRKCLPMFDPFFQVEIRSHLTQP